MVTRLGDICVAAMVYGGHRKMRILLIDPPYERLVKFRYEWFPLGLSYIAACLRARGHEVTVYGAEHGTDTRYESIVTYSENFSRYKKAIESAQYPIWDEVRKVISSFDPEVVGITVLTPKVPSAFRIAQICKSLRPETKVVFGGQHPTIRPEEMLSNQHVDFVVRGEGEQTFCEIVDCLQSAQPNYDVIAGLSFRKDKDLHHNPDRARIEELNPLPLPARDRLFDFETYTPAQLSMIMTSRGCPFQCGFCSSQNMWGRQVRFRSIDNVLDEILELKEKHSVRHITFMDDSFTVSRNRVEQMCRALIDNHVDINWSCLTRVDMISDEVIKLMKRAGCAKLDIGIESGNQRILDLIKKDITLEDVRKAVRILKHNNMFWSGFFMFGFPTETEEEVLDTLQFLYEIKPDWANISIFTAYPGTPLYTLAKQKGMISEPVDYTLYSHQNPYHRSTDSIPQEKFAPLGRNVLKQVHRYNSSCRSLFKRALTRKYHKNPMLLFADVKKAAMWMKR